MKPTDFAIYLSKYFATYLPGQLGESINTVLSYRDTFALFLRYCKERENLPPEKLTLSQINANLIEGFLNWVEYERGCCVGTRNNRLAAIHAFYRYLQYELPEMLLPFQEILSIPFKKTQKKLISYLTLDGIKCLLAQPNKNTYSGLRDLCLLSLLYDTGARVQEIVDLKMEDVRLSYPTVIRLTGKGRKTRQVPIMKNTEEILRNYLSIHDSNYMFHNNSPLFCNRTGVKLTRAGISYILKKYTLQAKAQNESSIPEKLSPHSLRHSKAMHLLQAGVNLVYIRDLLGHADISTTEIYARADESLKRKALETAYESPIPNDNITIWQKDTALLDWLNNLGK